jgi:hypothetical protein
MFDPIAKFVQVRSAPAAVGLDHFSVGNIVGCTQSNPEIAAGSKTGDGSNERRIVNSHIDLASWKHVNNL